MDYKKLGLRVGLEIHHELNTKEKLCLTNIYKKINEEDIILSIFPNADLNGGFFSIRNEKNGSANIMKKSGSKSKYFMKDFGDPEQTFDETWYQWVARQNGWDCKSKSGFLKSLNWANNKFNLGLQKPSFSSVENFKSGTVVTVCLKTITDLVSDL